FDFPAGYVVTRSSTGKLMELFPSVYSENEEGVRSVLLVAAAEGRPLAFRERDHCRYVVGQTKSGLPWIACVVPTRDNPDEGLVVSVMRLSNWMHTIQPTCDAVDPDCLSWCVRTLEDTCRHNLRR
ncbi:MAG: hypothetical protein ACYTF0_09175, partial [Planctomycetota bacterium]